MKRLAAIHRDADAVGRAYFRRELARSTGRPSSTGKRKFSVDVFVSRRGKDYGAIACVRRGPKLASIRKCGMAGGTTPTAASRNALADLLKRIK